MNIDRIAAAAERLAGHALRTPLLNAPLLDDMAGRRVFVKPECLQRTGSFKYRGARSALSALSANDRERGVLAYSSGNHAQGVACAAREMGIPAVIVMPSDAPTPKIANTRAYGAEIVPYDRAAGDRETIGRTLADKRGLSLVRPFDNEDVIAGQGTCGIEIAEQASEAGIGEADVLVPCGGGGLSSGIALALEARAPHLRVRPVEPEGFDDVARSLIAGTRQANARMTGSICDAIVTPAPGRLTFPILQRLCGPGIAVPDEDALRAIAAAFTRLGIVLEPGGAVALAAALFRRESDQDVIVVASGGNVDSTVFRNALNRIGKSD